MNNAQSYLEQSTHRLDAFEQFVGDGTIYATGDGFLHKLLTLQYFLLQCIDSLYFVPDFLAGRLKLGKKFLIGCEKGDRIVDVRELVFYMPETAGKEGAR